MSNSVLWQLFGGASEGESVWGFAQTLESSSWVMVSQHLRASCD